MTRHRGVTHGKLLTHQQASDARALRDVVRATRPKRRRKPGRPKGSQNSATPRRHADPQQVALEAAMLRDMHVLSAHALTLRLLREVNREYGPLHVKALLHTVAARFDIDLDRPDTLPAAFEKGGRRV